MKGETIKTVLIDDEPAASDVLSHHLTKHFPQIELLGIADSAKEGLMLVAEQKPDLIFLDIDMPWMNGLELVKVLPNQQAEVIFVTAHDELAVKAIRTSALDFLTKPVSLEELKAAIDKYESSRNKKSDENLFAFLSEQMEAVRSNKLQRIALPSNKGISFIELSDICMIEADNIYAKLSLLDGKQFTVFKALKDIELMLENEPFYRCHKSFIVNLHNVTALSKLDGGSAILKNGARVSISRSKRHEFTSIMNNL